MPPLDEQLQSPMILDRPEVKVLGDRVSLIQVHLSLLPTPVLHIGYGIGPAENTQHVIRTVAYPVGDLATRFGQVGSTLADALQSLVATAYRILSASGAIGTGMRA